MQLYHAIDKVIKRYKEKKIETVQLNFLAANHIPIQTAFNQGDPTVIHGEFISILVSILRHIINSQQLTTKTTKLLYNVLIILSAYFECKLKVVARV